MKLRLATVLAFLLFSTACQFSDPGPPNLLESQQRVDEACPDGWVPGDPIECWPLDIRTVEVVPQPQNSSVACTIVRGFRLGSVDRDGTVHWYWNGQHLNSRMQEMFGQMCWSSWLSTMHRLPFVHAQPLRDVPAHPA